MTLIKKVIYSVVLVTTSLGFGSVFAQSEQANDKALEATANAQAQVEADQSAVKEGESIVVDKAEVVKEEGEAAVVSTPESGKAEASTPNRGVAAEARTGRPNPAESANSLRGEGR